MRELALQSQSLREAWEQGLKTTYYVRSTSQAEIEECEACQS